MYRNITITLCVIFVISAGSYMLISSAARFSRKIEELQSNYRDLIVNNNQNIGKTFNIKELIRVKDNSFINTDELFNKQEYANIVVFSYLNCFECNQYSLKQIDNNIVKDNLPTLYIVKDCDEIELVKRLYHEYSKDMYFLPSYQRDIKSYDTNSFHQATQDINDNTFITLGRPFYIRINKDGIVLKFCYLDRIENDLLNLFLKG